MTAELIAPISVDLRAEDYRFNIIKGIEHINVEDQPLSVALQGNDLVELGDWLVKDNTNTLVAPTTTAVYNTYPVWVGNDQYDAQATQQATIIVGGGFVYQTNKYVAGSYSAGQALTVKDLGGGERVPSAAGGSDAVLARVFTPPNSKNVMEVLVLNR